MEIFDSLPLKGAAVGLAEGLFFKFVLADPFQRSHAL